MKRDFRLQPSAFSPRPSAFIPVAFAVGLCLVALAAGAVGANPYEAIVGRNVFGLKPPALNAPPPPPPAAAATIKLLGISTILDRRQVMLKVKTAARPPEPAKEQSYLMSQGQREDEIEVLEIDAATGTVKIKNQDEILSLSMKDDAEKPAAGAVLPGVAVPPPLSPGMVSPNPGQLLAPGGGSRTIPTRSLRASPTDGASAAPGSATTDPATQPSAASQRSIEENVALYEINRAKNEALIQSGVRLPRMPPHSLLKQQSQ